MKLMQEAGGWSYEVQNRVIGKANYTIVAKDSAYNETRHELGELALDRFEEPSKQDVMADQKDQPINGIYFKRW